MIDTLMALWNQDRRKRAGQVILTFLLMCIGISLLFVITNKSALSQQQSQQASVRQTNPTVPTFGNTVVPDLTPAVSVVVGTQLTPGVIKPQSTPAGTSTQPTPISTTTTQPCVTTPSNTTGQTSSLYANAFVQQNLSPTITHHQENGTPTVPLKHFDGGGGGGPVGTPALPTPTPISQATPSSGSVPTWVPNCTTSNNLGIIARSNVLPVLLQNIWLILGGSLLGTIIFYTMLFTIRRRMRVNKHLNKKVS